MNLLDLYENREPYQQAIDKLEQRRIEDLEAKMDDYAQRGMKDEFQKCKAERDSYHKIKETRDTTEKDPQGHATGFSHEGDWKKIPKNKAGRPVDPRGEVTHLSDLARREAERAAQDDVAEGAGEFLYKKLRPSQYGGVDVVGFKQAPRNSVLSGQVLKHFIDSYETEEEALKAHPDAEGYSNKYTDPQVSLRHLPGEDDPVAGGMYPDDIDEQGMSEGAESSPVAGAIVNRIMRQCPDLLTQYGPKLISAAVDEVADYVGDVDEIGSSDVSGWVNQVERMLKENPPEAFGEAGIGQDLVTPQQRVQQSTPQKQTPVQKVGSTVKHAAKWVAGQGGPGKEGPTYEEAELDEQTSPVNTAKLVWAQIAKAVNSNVDVATITWPNGESQKLTRNQLWHIDQKARTMSRQARNQFALKTFVDVNNLMYYLGTLKAVKPRPQLRPEVDPSQPSLDLPKPTLEDSKKKDRLTTPGDPESEVAIKLARSRNPTAKSDLAAVVKDKIATDKTVKKEIDQVKADNERQEKEIQRLEKETDALSIATSNAGKPKNFDPDRGTTTPLPPSAGASVPATGTPPAAITTTPDIASPVSYPTPEPTTAKDTAVTPEPTPAKDLETPVTKPPRVQYRQVSQPTRLSNRPARSPSLTAPKTPDTIPLDFGPGWEEVPATNNKKSSADDDFDIINFDDALAADETDAVIKKASGKTTKKQRSRATAESVDEGQMSELDIARQDLELMTDRQFYIAYGISKAAFQQKYRALLKPADPGYANESVDDDDWDEDEGDFVNDPTAHSQVRKHPLPDSVLRAIERDPAMRADIIAAYKRKQGIAEGPDLINMSDLQFYKELLAVLVIPIAGLGAAAWHRAQNALKLYRAEDVINALNKKGITVDRATLGQIKPLLLKLEQAIDVDRDGDAAKELAQRIQQTVAWGKLKQTSARPATPVQGRDEPGVTEGTANPKFIIAQVTRLLATEARRMTNAPIAQLLAPLMKEYNLTLQQIDAMVPGGLRKAAGEYGIMMKEAANPAQQAAIAIAMKRAGKKPKSVDESYTGVMQSQGITNPKLLKTAARIDRLAESFK